jgi:hypothetical protein
MTALVRFILRAFAALFGLAFAPVFIQLVVQKSYAGAAVCAVIAALCLRYAFMPRKKKLRRKSNVAQGVQFTFPETLEAEVPVRSRGRRKPPAPLVDNIWPAKHGFACEVVGESHYQDALTAAVGGPPTEWREATVMASLVCETDNPHDSMAVAVFVNGGKVGYLRAEAARAFHERLKRRGIPWQTTHCGALVRGGGTARDGSQRMYGIMLNIQPFN